MLLTITIILCILSVLLFRQILNPFLLNGFMVLVAMVFMPPLREFMLRKDMFSYADWIILLYLLSFFLGTMAKTPKWQLMNSPPRDNRILSVVVILSILILPVVFIKLKEYPFSMTGFREFYFESRFEGYGFFFTAGSYLLLFLILYFVHNRRYMLAIIITPILLLFGQKTILLALVLGLLFILESQKVIRTSTLILLMLTGLASMVALHFALSIGVKVSPLVLAIGYFDYYDNFAYLIRSLYVNESIDHYWGRIFITDFYKVIPRFIWEEKPEIYGQVLLHAKLYPDLMKIGHTPSFFEPIAIPLADFGILGVTIFGLFRGYLSRLLYNAYLRSGQDFTTAYLYLFSSNVFAAVLSVLLIVVDKLTFKASGNADHR